jgi:hypothetical protein
MLNALRYLVPLIGVLCFLWFSTASLYPKGSFRKAEMLFGLCGMAYFGSILYGVSRSHDPRAFVPHELRWVRTLLAGVTFGIFVTLVLEGSFRPFKSRGGTSGESEPPER